MVNANLKSGQEVSRHVFLYGWPDEVLHFLLLHVCATYRLNLHLELENQQANW